MHTFGPSYLGGLGRRVIWTQELREQPGQQWDPVSQNSTTKKIRKKQRRVVLLLESINFSSIVTILMYSFETRVVIIVKFNCRGEHGTLQLGKAWNNLAKLSADHIVLESVFMKTWLFCVTYVLMYLLGFFELREIRKTICILLSMILR